jgi:hypothetical protein
LRGVGEWVGGVGDGEGQRQFQRLPGPSAANALAGTFMTGAPPSVKVTVSVVRCPVEQGGRAR